MTHTVTVCLSGYRQLARGQTENQPRPSEEERDNGSFYFSTTHSSGRKGAGLPACCLNLRQTSSSCLGHGTSQSLCHFVPQRCHDTIRDFFCFFFQRVCTFVAHFSLNNTMRYKIPFIHVTLINGHESSYVTSKM